MNTNTEMKINCGICGAENDRTKNGKPCMEIDGKGACLKCVISSSNKDSEEFGEECEEENKLETKCGCEITINSREHNECRCDDDGENWICADCYNGEYDEDGKCFECGGEIDQDFQDKLDRAGFIDGRGEVCCEKCWKENWEASGEEYDECEECDNLFELGTFHTIEEEDGTQFCFCDGCRDMLVENGSIFATEEEGVYVRELRKCEQCDCEDKEKLAEYWWNETAGKKWTLCEDCGIAEEQEKC